MSLVSEMTQAIRMRIGHVPDYKCPHLRSGLDAYEYFPDPEHILICRTCAEEGDFICSRCADADAPNTERVWCILTVKHFGASAWEDHFVATLCLKCGKHISDGVRPLSSSFEVVNDAEHILIIEGRVERGSSLPKLAYTDKQAAKLARSWKKVTNKV